MPIGFWAISRNEIMEMLEARTGLTPASWFLDRIVKTTRDELDKRLDEIIESRGQELKEDLDKAR